MDKSKIILINKPSGLSSYKVIRNVAKSLDFKKIGHAGTLDPLATGLMIAMSNKATKLSDLLMKKDKSYYVELQLGYMTDTLDLEGEIIQRECIPNIDLEDIQKVLCKFIGKIEQVPPKYSAIKVNGKKLYELARKNIEVEIKKRKVKIYNISDVKFGVNEAKISFVVEVSSGTYIRSLVRDIGFMLNTCATMTFLKRLTIDKFKNPEDIEILDVDKAIILDKINVDENELFKLKNGQTILIKDNPNTENIHAYLGDKYLGICEVIKDKENFLIKRTSFFI